MTKYRVPQNTIVECLETVNNHSTVIRLKGRNKDKEIFISGVRVVVVRSCNSPSAASEPKLCLPEMIRSQDVEFLPSLISKIRSHYQYRLPDEFQKWKVLLISGPDHLHEEDVDKFMFIRKDLLILEVTEKTIKTFWWDVNGGASPTLKLSND